MPRVVIVGAGIGGLASALMLARAGNDVIVCERDQASAPSDPELAWTSWPRPGTPQARLGHAFLPGFRRLLAARLGDVLDDVLAAGAPLIDHAADLPGGDRRPGDEELITIAARRPVLEAVMRRSTEAEPHIQLIGGCRVTGLTTKTRGEPMPHVTGVTTASHGVIDADAVIVAGGRGTAIGRWFSDLGAPLEEDAEGCGFACYTRYFRLRAGIVPGGHYLTEPTIHRAGEYMVYEIWGADAGTFAAEIIVPVADRALHELRHEAVWMGTASALPDFPEWIDPDRAEPITPGVAVMGQERNVLRHLVVDDRPLARGIHVIGDARCQSDSLFAWGCANTLKTAVAVVDAIADHPHDPDAQALSVEARVGDELAGRFHHARERDRAALRAARGEPRWDDALPDTGMIDQVLWPAAQHDPDVSRAVMRWEFQLDSVDDIRRDPSLAARAQRALDAAPPAVDEVELPTREELVAITAAAATGRTRRSTESPSPEP